MNEVFAIQYGTHLNGQPLIFSITESGDGTFGIANGGVWAVIPPIAYEPLLEFLHRQIVVDKDPVVSKAGWTPKPSTAEAGRAMPQDAPAVDDSWNCGNRKLQAQLAIAMMTSGKAAARDACDIEYLADRAGPAFTATAIQRLIPGYLVEDLTDDELPF